MAIGEIQQAAEGVGVIIIEGAKAAGANSIDDGALATLAGSADRLFDRRHRHSHAHQVVMCGPDLHHPLVAIVELGLPALGAATDLLKADLLELFTFVYAVDETEQAQIAHAVVER